MADLNSWLNAINIAAQATAAAEPHIGELATDQKQQGVIGLVQVAGAAAAAVTTDPESQKNAAIATQLAVSIIPSFWGFFQSVKGLFHKHGSTPTTVVAAPSK